MKIQPILEKAVAIATAFYILFGKILLLPCRHGQTYALDDGLQGSENAAFIPGIGTHHILKNIPPVFMLIHFARLDHLQRT